MKIALYIEDGLEQIVLTPETEIEKGILAKLHDDDRALAIKKGSFFKCRGGWMRHGVHARFQGLYDGGRYTEENDQSTMLVLTKAPPQVEMGAADIAYSDEAKACVQERDTRTNKTPWPLNKDGYTLGN